MPRQSRGPARAPSRPTAAPARPAPPPQTQQTRPASTAAHPQHQQQQAPPAQGRQGGGMLSNIASTAAGVAVGSSIGHMVGGFFGGGSSAQAPPADQPVAQQDNGSYAVNQNYTAPQACQTDITNFRTCMDQNQGNLTICGWYLDQLKACQQAAAQY